MIGAQRNLNVYGAPTRAKRPMAVLLTPTSLSHMDSVENVKSNGSPLEKPKNMIAITLGLRYTVTASEQR